jgi:hypothetical protein
LATIGVLATAGTLSGEMFLAILLAAAFPLSSEHSRL